MAEAPHLAYFIGGGVWSGKTMAVPGRPFLLHAPVPMDTDALLVSQMFGLDLYGAKRMIDDYDYSADVKLYKYRGRFDA